MDISSDEEIFDVFVSYRYKDGELISRKVAEALKDMGYSVYHNSDRNHRGKFPDRLRRVIDNSRDFLLIVTENCLERLIADKDSDSPDWVKEELLEAIAQRKNIIPVMIESIEWPHLSGLSNEATSLIRDLSLRENIRLPMNFEQEPPLILLCGKLYSKPNAGGKFRYQKNDPKYADMKELLEHLTAEANEGSPVAMYQLAIFYRDGLCDMPSDSSKEYYWLQKLLQINDESDELKRYKAHALLRIGDMYYCGEIPGERQSFVKSYEYKAKASEMWPDNISLSASIIYMKSWVVGVEFDYENIVRAFKNIDELENADASMILHQAQFYDRYGNFACAIDLYSRVYHIYNDAAYRLGMLYLYGLDTTPPDPNGIAAAYYLKEAADNGHADAAYELGRLYFCPTTSKTRSKNIHQDVEKAVKYFKIAANSNHTNALYHLGWLHCHNFGMQNFVKATEYAEKAARNGSINAMGDLIFLYQCEECKNYERAYYYAVKIAEGSPNAAFSAGYFLLFGCGCEPDLQEAKKYFKMAFEHGVLEAGYMLNLIKEIEEKGNASK